MSASQVVTVTVTKQASLPSRAGFETVLLAAYHELVGPRVISVTSIDDAEALGLTELDYPTIHRALVVMFSQNPRPSLVKVGRRDSASEQSLVLAPLAPQGEGYLWTVEIDGEAVTYEEQDGDTVALIIDGLVAAINLAALGMTAADGTTDMDLDADDPGTIHRVEVDLSVFSLVDDTADAGIAADLSAIQEADEDWYGLVLDDSSEATVLAAAAWVEARTKLLGADCYESAVPDPLSTTDVASDLEAALRTRTFLYWTEGRVGAFYAAGRMAGQLAEFDPGEATWAFKDTLGVEAYDIRNPRQLQLDAKRVNYTASLGGAYVMLKGWTPSGEWIDVTRTIDWLAARQRELVLALLVARPKVAYTDPDIAVIQSEIRSFLLSAVASNVLAGDPEPTVTVPRALDVSAIDRANRLLPDVVTTARLANAVHEVDVRTILQV